MLFHVFFKCLESLQRYDFFDKAGALTVSVGAGAWLGKADTNLLSPLFVCFQYLPMIASCWISNFKAYFITTDAYLWGVANRVLYLKNFALFLNIKLNDLPILHYSLTILVTVY